MLIPCIASCLLYRMVTQIMSRPFFPFIVALLMEIGTISHMGFVYFPNLASSLTFSLFVGLINACGSFLMVLTCIILIAAFTKESDRLSTITFAVLFKLLIYLAIDGLPEMLGYAAVLLMPIGFALFARKGLKKEKISLVEPTTSEHSSKWKEQLSISKNAGIPIPTFALLIVLPFCIEYIRGYVLHFASEGNFSSNTLILATTLLFVLFVATIELLSISKNKPSIMPIAVSIALIMSFLFLESPISVDFALALAYASFFLYRTILYSILSNYSAINPRGAVLVVGAGMGCDAIGHTGEVLLSSPMISIPIYSSGYSSVIIYLVAITSAILFFVLQLNRSSLAGSFESIKIDPAYINYSLQGVLNKSVNIVADQYGLTAREAKILELIAMNKSYTQIADALTISSNTVKTHQKHIYQKLNIHSADEIFPILNTVSTNQVYNTKDNGIASS